ncbi:MAG: hypothetical protein PHW86_03785 [Candidatus Bipolaricaulis sp.]|nr:hypothetical protein [Candidatus Bipolaricaulis sp.]
MRRVPLISAVIIIGVALTVCSAGAPRVQVLSLNDLLLGLGVAGVDELWGLLRTGKLVPVGAGTALFLGATALGLGLQALANVYLYEGYQMGNFGADPLGVLSYRPPLQRALGTLNWLLNPLGLPFASGAKAIKDTSQPRIYAGAQADPFAFAIYRHGAHGSKGMVTGEGLLATPGQWTDADWELANKRLGIAK